MIRSIKKFLSNFVEAKKEESEELKVIRVINYIVDNLTSIDPNVVLELKNISKYTYHVNPLNNVVGAYMKFYYKYNEQMYYVCLSHLYGIHSTCRIIRVDHTIEFETENKNLTISGSTNNIKEIKNMLFSLHNEIMDKKKERRNLHSKFMKG